MKIELGVAPLKLPLGERLRLVARLPERQPETMLPRIISLAEVPTEAGVEALEAASSIPGASGLRPAPGLPPPPGMPSHGSLLHSSGDCRPCMWFWKPSGCGQGSECLHCHFCPATEIADRRRKRRQYKKHYVASDCSTSVGSPSERGSVCSTGSSQNSPSSSPRPSYITPPPGLF